MREEKPKIFKKIYDDLIIECQRLEIINQFVFAKNIQEIVEAGRTRRKIENENNNILKTKD